jgi:catechol 2,3-dioxygenase-like lactoylglutathione lyase family enzyme
MKGARLDHVSVTTADLEASIAFYRDLLRLPLVGRGESEGPELETMVGAPGTRLRWAELALGGGQTLELLHYLAPSGDAIEPRPWAPGATHIGLAVEDLDALVAELEAAGVAMRSRPVELSEEGEWKGVRCLYATDPDGVIVELVQRPAPEIVVVPELGEVPAGD